MINIRYATPTDVETIYQFICELEEMVFDRQQFELCYLHNLNGEKNIYLFAELDGKTVGYLGCQGQLLLHHMGWVYEIQEMYVAEDMRGQQVGKALLEKLESILSERDFDTLEVSSNNKRKRAHGFYTQNGFTQSHQKFTKKNTN
jgi:PhnO protein